MKTQPLERTSAEDVERFLADLEEFGVLDDIKAICLQHGTRPRELRGPSREKHVTQARYEAMRLVHDRFGWSNPTVGRFFDRDSSIVNRALKTTTAKKSKTSTKPAGKEGKTK